jgi:hypothetical protein
VDTPEEGLAEAIGDLTDQTRALVQREVDAARTEMWEKARASAPALALLGVSAALGLGAAASGYRWTMRFFEKMMPPAAAAAFGTTIYGIGAAVAGALAAQRLRDLPMPVPTRAVQAASDAVGRTARSVAGEAKSAA